MNTFVLLGLVLLLVLFLVRSKRRRAAGDEDAPSPGRGSRGLGLRRREPEPAPAPAAPAPQHDPFASPATAPFAAAPSSFGGGAPVDSFPPVDLPAAAAPFTEAPAPAPAPAPVAVSGPAPLTPAASEPSDWRPEEMIVEPGWPLPGEIAGAWGDGPSAAVSSPVATLEAPTAVLEPSPLAETAATTAPPAPVAEESWEMPSLAPVPAAEEPAPDAELPLWRPEEPVAEPVEDIWIPAEPSPMTEPVAPAPVVEAELPVWSPDPEPLAPVAHIEPEPFIAPEPEPFVAPEPTPEPVLVVAEPEPAPVWEPVAAAAPVVPAPADWPAEVATLLPAALEAVRPLVSVCDHVGVTPRMLVVMRALADRPLSVGEQASLLGVSRPVVADVAARLESLGLTRREKDEADRRRVRIGLTPKGRRVVADATDVPSADRIAIALAGLDDAGRAALVAALRTLSGSAS